MDSFNKLRKLSNSVSGDLGRDAKLAILGDTATQLLSVAIKGYAYSQGVILDIYESEYNQIFSEIIDDNSGLYNYVPDYCLIYMSSEKLYEAFCSTPLEDRSNFASSIINKITAQWSKISSRCRCRILQCNFAENDDKVFGQFGNKNEIAYIYQLRKLNYLLMESASKNKNVYISDIAGLQNIYGRNHLYSDKYYYSARLAVGVDSLPYIAKAVVDLLKALQGKIKKCVVLDLDNTLWGGVIGDDGLDNIQIGELGTGRAFTDFQLWLKQLKQRGILLAVCSKNNEDTAKEPFEKHPDMVLRLDDFVAFVANWEDKASNIRSIQKSLNIGMDSMVFLDDNPFERNLVRQMIPEIMVPELPEDPALYLSFLKQENLFETASYSNEDVGRTAQYQAEAKRVELQSNFQSLDDYLTSLKMVGEAKPFDSFHVPRIAQLTQRSNQFNLRTVRYTEAEIQEIMNDSRYITIYFTLKDQFGDHGLISVVIMERQGDALFINTWLMSCRVLKRTVEEFIINTIMKTAEENGFEKVIGEYIPTPKNSMVKDIYEKLGFIRKNDNIFEADVRTFKYNKCFINL